MLTDMVEHNERKETGSLAGHMSGAESQYVLICGGQCEHDCTDVPV